MARHPWYICALCRDRITDAEGYLLEFGNTSVSGGFAWRRVGEGRFQEALGFSAFWMGAPSVSVPRVSAASWPNPTRRPARSSGQSLMKREDDRPMDGRPPRNEALAKIGPIRARHRP
jgi:hypothetical protein